MSRTTAMAGIALALITPATIVQAQSAGSIAFPANYAAGVAPCVRQSDGSCVPVSATAPMPTTPRQESVTLVNANAAAAPTPVYGGNYSLTQACTSYNAGALTLRYRGPDGATMMTLLTKTATDSAGGTLVSLGSGAIVDVTLPAGSTGCNVLLARVP